MKLQSLNSNIRVLEEGLNGRTCASDDCRTTWLPPNCPDSVNGRKHLQAILHSAKPVSIVIISLGVNDLKSRFNLSAKEIAAGASLLIDDVLASGNKEIQSGMGAYVPRVVLISPPPIVNETYPDFANGGIAKSKALGAEYAAVAKAKGVEFLDAGCVEGCVSCDKDGIHLEEGAHAALANAVNEKLVTMLPPAPARAPTVDLEDLERAHEAEVSVLKASLEEAREEAKKEIERVRGEEEKKRREERGRLEEEVRILREKIAKAAGKL